MLGLPIVLDKQPGVHLVRVGETWRCIFVNIVINFTGPEATMACQDDQLCDGIKAGIDNAVHGVQAIWDEKLTTDDWVILLVDAKTMTNKIN